MAYSTTTPLNDSESNDFLKSKGFVNVSSCCGGSVWVRVPTITLTLDRNFIVRRDHELYQLLFDCGRSVGEFEYKGRLKRKLEGIKNEIFNNL